MSDKTPWTKGTRWTARWTRGMAMGRMTVRDATTHELIADVLPVEFGELVAAAPEMAEVLERLLDEAEDVFNCMADATDIDRLNYPAPYTEARSLLARIKGGSHE